MELYPFQKTGVDFLTRHPRAYLADEMGLGKTVQAIVAQQEVFRWAERQPRTLVICPASVSENWRREWALWEGHGQLLVRSYASLLRHPVDPEWADLVILDEAHYCKSISAKRTRSAMTLARAAPRAWLLSGTPMPNDPRELWPMFKYLWPELHIAGDTAFTWMNRYCKWSDSDYGYRVWGTTPLAKTELVPNLKKFMLRRRLKDIALDLPSLRFTVQHLDKNPDLAEELENLGADMEGEEHMSTMRRILGTYKAPRVAEIVLEELREEQYRDVVVLYHHHDTAHALVGGLSKVGLHLYGFDGSAPPSKRQEEIDGFQQHGGIFLAQQGAAGIGITLTRAHEIILVEPSWSPEDNWQAIKRIHRIGQDAPCRARLFAVPGSMDEALMNTLRRKSAMVKEVVDGP